jgi:hypothetical protein
MVIMHIKKSMRGENGKIFNAGDVYVTSELTQAKLTKALADQGAKNAVEFFPVNFLWDPFEYGMNSEILIIRTGGIGDLIAMSCIGSYCWHNTIRFLTNETLFPIFKWWETNNVNPRSITEPVYRGYRPIRASMIRNTTHRVYAEGLIEEGKPDNWFEVFFGAIGVKKVPVEMLRPQLQKDRISNKPSHINLRTPSIIVVHSASAPMRSFPFELAYKSIVEVIGTMDVTIYVHNVTLTAEDFKFLETVESDERIRIINNSSLDEYLLDLYDATITFSTDTAAIHFREGVEKPAIAVYSSFTTDARTKFYQHTLSFNLTSKCDLQPCFIHQETRDHVCPKASLGEKTAPCMTWLNPTAQRQIVDNMSEYLLSTLKAWKP